MRSDVSRRILSLILIRLALCKSLMLLPLLLIRWCHLEVWLHRIAVLYLLSVLSLYLPTISLKQMFLLDLQLVNFLFHSLKLLGHLIALLHSGLKLLTDMTDNFSGALKLLICIVRGR